MPYFNTTGPCIPGLHYMLPPEPRLPQARGLIEQGMYFVVHAPRQTGKTTTLAALTRSLGDSGRYAVVRISCEAAGRTGDNYFVAEHILLSLIQGTTDVVLPPDLRPPKPWPAAADGVRLLTGLRAWAQQCPVPVVLFLDEIDALWGDSLLSVLHQLRDGYTARPLPFIHSVVLCGLRDIRDYRLASGGDPRRLGTSSPFNVSVESMRIDDFTEDEISELYGQHTAETGRAFTDDAVARAWECTAGQPWLVNALARELTQKMDVPASEPITAARVEEAKERLIRARATHLDQLAAKLAEPRVRRILCPFIAGGVPELDATYDDDVAYLRDLGLLAPSKPMRIANPIYREVIVRVLGTRTEEMVDDDPRSFVLADGRLDFDRLLREFAEFWRQNSEVLLKGEAYHEAAPHLILMAYLTRIVNGGGYVDREYGVGRGRVDLLIRWPYLDPVAKRQWQREAVELKVWREGEADPTPTGLQQLDRYLDRLGLDRGTLVVFDRRPTAPAGADRIAFADAQTPNGRAVTLLRG